MSLRYAILGILNAIPMTGYDLKHQAFDTTVRHFWPADQSQIYRTLNQLAEDEFATVTVETQADRPDRKVYAITDSGHHALNEWLKSDTVPPNLRDPLLVQLFFGQEMSNAALQQIVFSRLRAHQERLTLFEQMPIPPKESIAGDRWLTLQHMTLDFGLALEQAYVTWLKQCQAVIDTMPEADEVPDFRDRFDSA